MLLSPGALLLPARPTGRRTAKPSAIGSDWLVPVATERRPATGDRPEPSAATTCCATSRSVISEGPGMLVVNAGGSGVFRLRYEDGLLDDILAGFDRLEPLERFNARRRHLGGALAGSTPLEQFLALVAGSRASWTRASGRWSRGASASLDFAVSEPDRGVLEAFVQSLFRPELETVGWDARRRRRHELARRRAIIIGTLGTVGADPEVRAESHERFAALRQGAELHPDIALGDSPCRRRHRRGGTSTSMLLEHFRAPADPLEEQRYLDSLS